MPHRTAEFREMCLRCGERSTVECLRCGDPFCADHAPISDRRCQDCESDYLTKLFAADTKSDRRGEIWGGLLGATLVLPGFVWLATKKYRERRRHARARRAFLAERPMPGAMRRPQPESR